MIATALRRHQTKTRWCIYPHYVGRIYVGFVKLVHKYSRWQQLGLPRGQIRPSRQNFGRQKTKMQIDFFSADCSQHGDKLYSADNSDFGLEYKTVDLKNINKRLGQKYWVEFRWQYTTRGLKTNRQRNNKRTADDYGRNPTVANNVLAGAFKLRYLRIKANLEIPHKLTISFRDKVTT